MPQYFFHVKNGLPLVIDQKGKELSSIEEARAEAKVLAAAVRAEMHLMPDLIDDFRVEITDARAKLLDVVSLDGKPSFL